MLRFTQLVFVFFAIVTVVSCDRWNRPKRPDLVHESADYDRKRGLWHQTVDGINTVYYEDGSIAWTGKMINGLKTGLWRWYAPDGGPLTTEGMYQANRRIGLWKHYDDSGRLYMTLEYKLEPFDPFLTMLHSDYGNENGPFYRYYPDGQTEMEGRYLAGKEQGPVKAYHRNGKLMMTGQYEQGAKTGTFRYYRDSGTLRREENYSEGLLHGPYRNYHSDGSLHSETFYEKGKETGPGRILPKK